MPGTMCRSKLKTFMSMRFSKGGGIAASEVPFLPVIFPMILATAMAGNSKVLK